MDMHKIDVHQHVVPPFWVEGLRERKSVHRPPAWSPQVAIDFMDSRRIGRAVLSLTAPGVSAWSDQARCGIAREVNEYTADLCAKWPDRLGQFATLPLPDMDGALAEIAYAFDSLKADGVVLLSNYGDRFLGDGFFEPIWQELDRRKAVVFIHPTRTTLPELEGIPAPFVDFPFATTRTAVDMVLKGVLDRYQKMRVILSHAGGFLPFSAHRFATCAATMPRYADEATLLATFRRFYFDTALSSNPATIAALRAFADPSKILFGSDFPYAPGGSSEAYTALLEGNALLSGRELEAIAHGNAVNLFGSNKNA